MQAGAEGERTNNLEASQMQVWVPLSMIKLAEAEQVVQTVADAQL
jgi:hypothetical protein